MSLTVDVRDAQGNGNGSVDLDEATFGIVPNGPVMHQVVTAQLAARRAGSNSTLTRAEVRGGGAKPWRQKGTGRSRQGSIRSPQWRGGGVALGPKPRSYRQRTPKKMVRLALRSALSDRAADARVLVVDRWSFDAPRTKDAVAALAALGVEGRVLVVLGDGDANAAKSFANLGKVHVCHQRELNAYDILCADWVIFTRETLPGSEPAGSPDRGTDVSIGGDAAETERSSTDDESRIGEAGGTEVPQGDSERSSETDDTRIAEGGAAETAQSQQSEAADRSNVGAQA